MKKSWNDLLLKFDNPHILQTSQWGEVKSRYGWICHYLAWSEFGEIPLLTYSSTGEFEDIKPRAAALVLERKVFPGLSVMYIPKGPHLDDWEDLRLVEQVLSDLQEFAREFGVIQLKIDPDVLLGRGVPGEESEKEILNGGIIRGLLQKQNWVFSPDQIQFRNSVLIDLGADEDEILGRMKSKTRYNIRLSGRKGISVRQGNQEDLTILYRMYADTSQRGGFTIRAEEYYQTIWNVFWPDSEKTSSDPVAQPLVADFEKEPVAGAVIFKFGKKAWYLHGMSRQEHSEKMAPHLVQWIAISWAKNHGCDFYDMWGAPDNFNETDALWGVYRFKKGYGGEVFRTIGAWDFPGNRVLYFLYTNLLPKVLGVMRWFGNRRTREITSGAK